MNKLVGIKKVNLAKEEMPGLINMINTYSKIKPLKGAKISGCMSVTVETAVLIGTLIELGAKVRWCSSNPMASDGDVIEALRSQKKDIFAKPNETPIEFIRNKKETLFKNKKFWPNLIIDDGSGLTKLLHDQYPNECSKIYGGTEETTSGVQEARVINSKVGLKFPIIAVNNSVTKNKFDNFYGCAESFVDGLKQSINILLAGKNSVVVGYGQVGKGVANILKRYGSNVTVVEVDPICALQAHMDGFKVDILDNVAHQGDLFVTTTGNIKVIPKYQVVKMKNGAILCNMGHENTEIEMPELIRSDKIKPGVKKCYLTSKKYVYLLGEGYIINLSCATGHSSFIMSCSFTNQVLAALFLWKNKGNLENQIICLPRKSDELVAKIHLDACNINIEKLTDEQREYQGLSLKDPFKEDNYCY